MSEGESLGSFDHVQTLMTRTVPTVHVHSGQCTHHQCLHVIRNHPGSPHYDVYIVTHLGTRLHISI